MATALHNSLFIKEACLSSPLVGETNPRGTLSRVRKDKERQGQWMFRKHSLMASHTLVFVRQSGPLYSNGHSWFGQPWDERYHKKHKTPQVHIKVADIELYYPHTL